MRITTSMMMKKYEKSLSDNLDRIDYYSNQMSTQRKFSAASEDPVDAVSSLKAMHQIASVSQNSESVDSANSWLSATETSTKTVDKILQSAQETLTAAKSGTNSDSDDENNATSLSSYQEELLQTLNTTFNGRYVYGGASTGNAPYKVGTAADVSNMVSVSDASGNPITFTSNGSDTSTQQNIVGKLLYYVPSQNKYVPVSDISTDSLSSADASDPTKLAYYNTNNANILNGMPVDMGMGEQMSDYKVVSGTAMDISTSALSFLCQKNTDSSAVTPSTNIYDQLGSAVTQLKNHDNSGLSSVLTYATSTQDSETKAVVVIGSKEKMADFLSDKFTNDSTNLTSKLSGLMDADATKAATYYSMSQMVYQASLSISSNVLQHTLIDFLK